MVRNGDVEATIVKARCGSDVRKLNVHHSDDLSHNDLLLMMQRIFKLEPTANVLLKYRDQEGDYVTLADDNDLILALQTEPSLSLIVLCDTVDGSQLKKLEQQLQDLRDSATSVLETLKAVDNLSLIDQKTELFAVENALKSSEAVATIQPSVNNSMMTTSFPPSINAKEEPLKPIDHHQEQVSVDGSLIQSVKLLENANVQSLDSSISSRESSHIDPLRSEVDLHSSGVQQNVPQFPPLIQQQHQQYLEEIDDHTVASQLGGQTVQPLKQSSQYITLTGGQHMLQPSSQHSSVFTPPPPPHQQQQQPQQQLQQQQFHHQQQHSQSVTPTIPTSDYHFGISSAAQTIPTYNTMMSNTAPRPPVGTTPPLTHQQPLAPHPPPNISQSSPFLATSGNPHGTFVAPQQAAFGVGVPSQAAATPFGVIHPPQHNPIGMAPYSNASTGAQQAPPPPSNVPSTMTQGFGRSSPAGFAPTGPPPTMFGQMSGGVNPFARGTNAAHHMRFHPPQQQ